MSEELKHKLFDNTDCISEQTMFDYINNRLSPKECHVVEKHLLDCELCSDALEGLRMVKDRGRISFAKEEVTKKVFLEEKKERKVIFFNYRVITGIAAALVLSIGTVFYFQQYTKKDAEQKEVALTKPEIKTDTIPVTTTTATTEPSEAESKPDELQQKTSRQEQSEKNKEKENTGTTKGSFNTIQQSNGASGYTLNANKATGNNNKPVASGAQTGKDMSGDLAAKVDEDNQEVVLLEKDKKVADEAKVSSQISYNAVSKAEPVQSPAPAFKKEIKDSESTKAANEREGKKNEESNYKAIGGVAKEDIPAKQTKARARARAEQAPEAVAAPQSANDVTIANTTRGARVVVTDSISSGNKDTDAAQYPGGTAALVDFIRKNFNYSLSRYDSTQTIKTKILVEFTVQADGTITDKKIKQGINAEINAEALRVVSIMPKWIPKVSGGKNVSSKMTLPFNLEVK